MGVDRRDARSMCPGTGGAHLDGHAEYPAQPIGQCELGWKVENTERLETTVLKVEEEVRPEQQGVGSFEEAETRGQRRAIDRALSGHEQNPDDLRVRRSAGV